MSQFQKPIRPQDKLGQPGIDVEMETEKLENDVWAQNTLKDIGKEQKPGDMDYLGSIAIHYYRTPDTTLNRDKYQIATKHQIAIGDLNEQIAIMGLSNLTIEMKRYYGHGHATRDTKDKRGKVN